jgi:hypothetical protein
MKYWKKHWTFGPAIVAIVMIAASITVLGQQITGDIRGTVTDSSGAVVAGATVEIKNTDQNAVLRTLKTGKDGSYVGTYLPVGNYQVTVTAQGFKTVTISKIALNVNDRRVVDISLKVGSSDQTVEVRESAVQVNLDSATSEGLINGTQISQLSVLSRNFVQLVTLMPGVSQNMASDQLYVGASNPTGLSNQINIVVNGNRPSQNSWLIDGAEDLNRGSNLTLYSYPSVDSIAEFKVLRSNYLPEHGRTSAGEVSVITKGGTNQFHGSAYEFFRNDKLNANDYFNNLNGIARPPMRWNDWGFTLGGPIQKDKTFFFYSQEWRHFIRYTTATSGQLPTAAEMAGNFPSPVCVAYDANNVCTQTGTTITNIDPVAAGYIKDIYSKLPVSTAPTGAITTADRNLYYYREEAVRLDHNFGQKLNVFGRYTDDSIPTQEPFGLYTGLNLPGVATTQSNTPAHIFSAHATATLSPTLLNDAGYTYSWGGITSVPIGTMAIANSPDINPTLPFPTTSAVVPLLSFQNGQGLNGFGPYRDYDKDQTVFDTISKSIGQHSLKFGATFNYYSHNENTNNYPSFTISQSAGCGTGSPSNCAAANNTFAQNWANFLLGRAYSFTEAQNTVQYLFSQKSFEFFGQDEWRLRPNFTVDYGIRVTFLGGPQSTNDLASTFDPNLYNAANAPAIDPTTGKYLAAVDARTLPGFIQAGKNSPYGQALVATQHGVAPRFGFAWDPTGSGKMSIRGGFGLFYGLNSIDNQLYHQTSNPGISPANTTFSNTSLSNPTGPAGGTATTTVVPPYIYGPNPNFWKLPYTEMFNLDLQRQLGHGMMFDVGYAGNLGRHLMGGIDVNQPHALAFQSIPGYCAKYNNAECYFHATDWRLLNYVRPYQGYDAINLWTSAFTSSYNGLQAQFTKQFTDNSLIVLNYTWSHNLTDASENFRGAENTYNLKRDWGNSIFDRRHVFSASYVYNLPFYKSQKGFVGHVLGGWEASGVVYLNTGIHYDFTTVSCNEDYVGLGTCGNSWAGDPPDQIADPNVGAPHTINQWFNPAAFAYAGCDASNPKCTPALPPLRQGDAARGQVVGPGIHRWDASVFKNFKIGERVNTQFRAEFFNALNNVNLALGTPATGLSTSLNSSLYDHILNARDPRNIQLALKVSF